MHIMRGTRRLEAPLAIDALTTRFSARTDGGGGGTVPQPGNPALAALDTARSTPYRRWDVDAPPPGAPAGRPGSRFGGCVQAIFSIL